jgi:membrane-associated phospholipid phosphatase
MYKIVKNIFSAIGNNGPLILFALSVFLLRNRENLLYYYILFFVIGEIFNTFIKSIIQQPRPSIDKKTFDLMMKNKERYIKNNGMPYDIFGMPSGHSQCVIYSTIFIYFVFHNIKLTLGYLLISLITITQRVVDRHHTVLQVIFGAICGLIIGYFTYQMVNNKITGKLSKKKDDYALYP